MGVHFKSPTHAEVAAALGAVPEAAAFVSGRDPKTNCWADLILTAQHDLPARAVAEAFKQIATRWEKHIVLAWCPWSEGLWAEYGKARALEDTYADKADRLRRFRQRTVFGTVGLIRPAWQKARREWMRQHGLKNERDPAFFKQIIFYLEESDDAPTG